MSKSAAPYICVCVCLCIYIYIYKSCHKDPRHTECSNLAETRWWNIYAIIKTMYPPGYHYNGFAATRALGHIYD